MTLRRALVLALAAFALLPLALLAPAAAADDPCAAPFALSAESRGVALLILKDGALLCERYGEGVTADTPMPLYSASKGFSGMMAAAAVADGLLTLEERAADTLTEWQEDPLKAKIRIRDLLALASGLKTAGPGPSPDFAEAIKVPADFEPGTRFVYGPIVYQTFGEIMRRKLAARGLDPQPTAYLAKRVLDPIGIAVSQWTVARGASDPSLAAGAVMSARAFAAFGELARLPAKAAAINLDPEAYEAQFLPSPANPGYGLTWWLGQPIPEELRAGMDAVARSVDLPEGVAAGGLPSDIVAAAGAGGQRLYVIRSLGLVVVRFAAFDLQSVMAARQQGEDRGRISAQAAVGGGRFSDSAFIRSVIAALPQ